jgi:hypothetical protein
MTLSGGSMNRKRSVSNLALFPLIAVLLACAFAATLPDLPTDKVDAETLYQAANKRAGEVTNGK